MEVHSLNNSKWVVFDLDGTLNRTDLVSVAAHQQAQKEYGQPVAEPSLIISTFGTKSYDYLALMAPTLTPEQRTLYDHRVASLEREFLKTNGKYYDGCDEMLKNLKNEGYHTAVCSNASSYYITGVLDALRLSGYIDEFQPMRKELSKAGTLKLLLERVCAQQAVMVGDRGLDMEAARENAIPFIGCLYGFAPAEIKAADKTVNKPLEIPAAVRELIG